MKLATLCPLLLLLPLLLTAQTPEFPAIPMPAGISFVASYNQLGTPRTTMGVSAIYPVSGQLGVYGTTTADVYPRKAIDPLTGRQFYAISAGIRQGLHKDLLDTGRFSFLVGGDVGPSFSQGQPTGIALNFSGSFVITTVYQISRVFSAIAPLRMLYVSGIGWNPVVQAGFVINLKHLPKAKRQQP